MIIGKRREGARKALHDLQSEMGFRFANGKILPAEQVAILKRIYSRNANFNGMSKEEREEAEKKSAELVGKIADKLRVKDGNDQSIGSISPFIQSTGGSHEKNTFTEYAAINVNNKVVILEPIGQANNATFIARYSEENKAQLEESIQMFGRKETVRRGILSKVTHETKQKGRYDCEGEHILEIIDYAIERPEELLDNLDALMQTQSSCALKTLGRAMKAKAYNQKMTQAIAEQAKNRGIDFNLQLFSKSPRREEGGFER